MQFNNPIYKTKLNPIQQLFTSQQFKQLVENSKTRKENARAIVRFFGPGGQQWILTEAEVHKDEETGEVEDVICFGLCDMGFGCPELGYVSMRELIETGRKGWRFQVERDLYFTPKLLNEY